MAPRNQIAQKWHKRLHRTQLQHVHSFADMQQSFEQPCMVYVLLKFPPHNSAQMGQPDPTEHYIGSTIHTLHKRQDTRTRKATQLAKQHAVSCELALHWFHSTNTFHLHIPLPLYKSNSTLQLRTLERHLIQLWNSPLNYPFIMQRHLHKPHSTPPLHRAILQHGHIGHRQQQRLRRRLRSKQVMHFYNPSLAKQQTAWTCLHLLAEQSQRSYSMQRLIRSNEMDADHVYNLYKLSLNMDDPPRTRVQSLIKKAIEFRQLPIPPPPKPLVLPLLSHQSFRVDLKAWLRQHAIATKPWMPTFFVPSCTVTSGKHDVLEGHLFNHFKWMQQFEWHTPPPCHCPRQLQDHPNLHFTTLEDATHIASPADQLSLPQKLRSYMATHAKTQVYPTEEHYVKTTWPTLQRWLHHHSIFTVTQQDWQKFVRTQWPDHRSTQHQWIDHADVKYLTHALTDFVVHCRDHAASAIYVYCPYLYWHTLKSTFNDTNIYHHLNITPTQATQYLHNLAQPKWLKQYRWGIDFKATCPISYILMKKKKLYLAARPIISYKGFTYAKLFRATAMTLLYIHQQTWPSTFGHNSLPQNFDNIHNFFQHLPDDIDLIIFNQDLAGFFTSIPASRIMAAVTALLENYQHNNPHLEPTSSITVDLKQTDTHLRLFRGKPRRASKQHHQIQVQHLLPLCELSLRASLFTQMGQCFQQVRGSAIGNQISPILANITVSHTEHLWLQSLQRPLPTTTFFTCRYVDNRLTMMHRTEQHRPDIADFLQPTFYQQPVLLEDEPDNTFLGCTIDPLRPSITYNHPTATWQFHAWTSATAKQHKLSAAYARIHLSANHTYPITQAHKDVETLIRTYSDLGYPISPLRQHAKRALAKRRERG